jgi:uncharacterized membrane protein
MTLVLHLFVMAVIAGLVHILSLVAIPRTMQDDVFSRLERMAGSGLHIVDPDEARALPFADPAVALAVCRYDLTAGPFRVRTGLSDTFLVVVFAEEGRGIFSSVSDRAATSGALDVVLANQEQLDRIAVLDDRSEAIEEIRVLGTRPRGIAILKVLVDRPSSRETALDVLRNARCDSEALP